MSRSAELRREQCGLSQFLFGQAINNLLGALPVLQNHRVQIPPKRRFDRRNKFSIDIDLTNERTDNQIAKTIGIVQAFEHGLRTLRESFAFRIELTQNLEARFFFGENALQPCELAFSVCE